MKLKHFLQKYSLDFYLHPNIIEAVEEWLKQKQIELALIKQQYSINGFKTITELLEELKEK